MPSPDKLTPLRRIRSGRAGYAQARAPDKLRLRRISSARPELIRRTSLNFFFVFERMSVAKVAGLFGICVRFLILGGGGVGNADA